MKSVPGLKYLNKTNWDDIFKAWMRREGTRKDWQQVAKEKGWPSWKTWRTAWINNFDAQNRKWYLYEIIDPLKTIPNLRIGPTQSWQKYFPKNERNKYTFSDLVKITPLKNNGKVQSMLEGFPESTEFIGIAIQDSAIVCIEGHHRAAALAIAAKTKKGIIFDKLPTIALTFFDKGEEVLLDSMLERGSINQQY